MTVTAAALLFVRAVVEAPIAWLAVNRNGGDPRDRGLLLGAFVMIERTVAEPLVRLAVLRSAALVRANIGALLLFGCATVFNVVNTLYEQDVLDWSPLKTGVVFMLASITTGLAAPRVGASLRVSA